MPSEPEGPLSPEHRCILIAVRGEETNLHFRVRAGWQSLVAEQDREYCAALFADLAGKAHADPEALFRQLCSLSAGPLITCRVGEALPDHPEIAALWEEFIDLGSLKAIRAE